MHLQGWAGPATGKGVAGRVLVHGNERGTARTCPEFQVIATGYEPSTVTCEAKSPSSANASRSGGSPTWPVTSMKNAYCHLPVCAGRDSMRFMLTPCRASGSSTRYNAPGWSRTNTSKDVRSLPDGGNSARPITRKRVVLSARSSIGPATTFNPYTCAALSPAIAAESSDLRARRAASALLDTACNSIRGRFWRSQPRHCASDCGCDITRSISSTCPLRDNRYWCTCNSTSPQIFSGDPRNKSSVDWIVPCPEFSTGTTPKSARPSATSSNTSAMLASGNPLAECPKCLNTACCENVPSGPR